jgi:leucyl/phenylalanyl-tRNA---protein transferase
MDAFPYYPVHKNFRFPDPEKTGSDGIVAVGGNLSPGVLLSAYHQGIFPWFSEGDPILWWSPDPRYVLYPRNLHVPSSLRRKLNKKQFQVSIDQNFCGVIAACAEVERPDRGTWITAEMINAYITLHDKGYAHSVEVWRDQKLVGGLYGVSVAGVFCGESMFSLEPDASKVAFVLLVRALENSGYRLIDAQVYTKHLARFGAEHISRGLYLSVLRDSITQQLEHPVAFPVTLE